MPFEPLFLYVINDIITFFDYFFMSKKCKYVTYNIYFYMHPKKDTVLFSEHPEKAFF